MTPAASASVLSSQMTSGRCSLGGGERQTHSWFNSSVHWLWKHTDLYRKEKTNRQASLWVTLSRRPPPLWSPVSLAICECGNRGKENRVTGKGPRGTCGDDRTVPCLDYRGGYLIVCVCWNSQNCTLKRLKLFELNYVNYCFTKKNICYRKENRQGWKTIWIYTGDNNLYM